MELRASLHVLPNHVVELCICATKHDVSYAERPDFDVNRIR